MNGSLRLFFFAILSWSGAEAAPVDVSFLRTDDAIQSTVSLLGKAECPKEALKRFLKAVTQYNSEPFRLEMSVFPQCQKGFYRFGSTSALVAALPHKLCDIEHTDGINCFDTIVLLTGGKLKTKLRADSPAGPFLIYYGSTNEVSIQPAATPRDACTLVYPQWYIDATSGLLPLDEERMCLTAALFSFHVLPSSTMPANPGLAVKRTLDWGWSRNGMEFPKNYEVVLCYAVNVPRLYFGTDHGGVLFRKDRGYAYIEKAGSKGPFVRLDVDGKEDLLPWLAAHMGGGERFGYTHYFASFNTTDLRELAANQATGRHEGKHETKH